MDNTVIRHPLYSIHKYDNGADGVVYDWWTHWNTCDGLFATEKEAVHDIEKRLGLSSDVVVLTREEYDELVEYKFRYEGLDK